MKSMDGITTRLNEVERESKRETETSYRLEYLSLAASLAQTLTGTAIQTTECWEMTWGRGGKLLAASDGQKLKCLMHCTPAQIDEIRGAWAASPFERDRVALVELDRLYEV